MNIRFTRGVNRYEIRRDIDLGFIGYVNGSRAVAAQEAHVVARILIAGLLIPRQSGADEGCHDVSSGSVLDRAG